MILNIRGPACSGKSHIVRQLLREYPASEVWERTGWNKTRAKQVGHLLPGGLFVVGAYSDKPGDGLAGLQPGRAELVTLWLERNCVRYPFIVFESTPASLSIGRYHEIRERLDAQLGIQNSITFAFLDTPVSACQIRAGTTTSASFLDTQWERVQQIRERLSSMQENCVTLNHEDAYAQLITLLQTIGGWDPFSTPPIIHPKVKTRYTLQNVWTELLQGYSGFPMNEGETDLDKRLFAEMSKHREKFAS
jgi:hypothetical protein